MKSRPVLSFGSLAGSLAKAQTQAIITRLQELHPRLTCQISIIPTPVDDVVKREPSFLATSASETEFLAERLLAGEFRLLVHRAADLPRVLPEGLRYAAVPARDTPFDAFLNRQGLIPDEMPEGAQIGVLNQRTKVQMVALWPRLNIRLLRSGLDAAMETFLRHCDVDGLVIPAAAAENLGIQGIVTEIFYPEMMLPSCGQGILVLLARTADGECCDLLAAFHSEATERELEAERAFMQRFVGNQDLPVSVLAQVERRRITVTGAIGALQNVAGGPESIVGPREEAARLGDELAKRLLLRGDGVMDLLEAEFPEGLPGAEVGEMLDEELDPALSEDLVEGIMDEETLEDPSL